MTNSSILETLHRRCEMGPVPEYAYILRCADGKYYFGSTGDLSKRLTWHQEGLSRWTASRLPVELVWYEECQSLTQARQRERSLKNGKTRRKTIDSMIRDFPPDRLARFA